MNIRSFISELKDKGLLFETKDQYSLKGEIQKLELEIEKTTILTPMEKPTFRFIFNLLNTKEKLAIALGTTVDKIHDVILKGSLKPKRYKIKKARFFYEEFNNLKYLPIIQHYEKDAGPYITSSIVTAKNPETKTQNFSIHRLRLLDKSRLVIRMVEGRHLHKIYTLYKEKGKNFPVSICLGVHPLIEIMAAYQAPYGMDELMIANAIRPFDAYLSPINRLAIPECEILIEGEVLIGEEAEDRMVEMLGNYDYSRMQPIIKVKRIYVKKDPIYRDILPASKEHRLLMSFPVEAKLNEVVKNTVPNVKKVVLSDGGCNWLHAVIQISKKVEGEAKNAILAAFTAHPSLKLAIAVDEDIDPENPIEVEYAMATRFQADEDLILIKKAKGSSLDPSSDQKFLLTDKVGIDATIPLKRNRDRFERGRLYEEKGNKRKGAYSR